MENVGELVCWIGNLQQGREDQQCDVLCSDQGVVEHLAVEPVEGEPSHGAEEVGNLQEQARPALRR